MGRKDLRERATWQDYSGQNAGKAEHDFYNVFKKEFEGSDLQIRDKPQEFRDIYVNVKLPAYVLKEIYTPDVEIKKHGIMPDYAIDNLESKKTLYVEVKRQDGWVEGKKRSAGRGNAHERSCKYFTPGLLDILRKKGGLGNNVLPFWTVFQGDITRDPCRVREVTCWFKGYSPHFFMWRDSSNPHELIKHFSSKLKRLLDQS